MASMGISPNGDFANVKLDDMGNDYDPYQTSSLLGDVQGYAKSASSYLSNPQVQAAFKMMDNMKPSTSPIDPMKGIDANAMMGKKPDAASTKRAALKKALVAKGIPEFEAETLSYNEAAAMARLQQAKSNGPL
jgi:hypothetical protein